MVNSNSELSRPVKLNVEPKVNEEVCIITEYETKILELEKTILEQQKLINELKKIIYNQIKNTI